MAGRRLAPLAGLMRVGYYIYEPMAEAADAKAYPPPGQRVDVGGYHLHINCAGTGSPTVVIDAGLGDWSTGLGFVQPEESNNDICLKVDDECHKSIYSIS